MPKHPVNKSFSQSAVPKISFKYQPGFWWCSKHSRQLEEAELIDKQCRENSCPNLLRAWSSRYIKPVKMPRLTVGSNI